MALMACKSCGGPESAKSGFVRGLQRYCCKSCGCNFTNTPPKGKPAAICEKKSDKLWIWRAYDPFDGRTVAWVLGRRDDATCRRLLDKTETKGIVFVTDDWDGYHRLIPFEQLFTGKDITVPIECDNSNIRHFLARFRRKTKVISKCPRMVDLSLKLYHHYYDRGGCNLGTKAMQAIFA